MTGIYVGFSTSSRVLDRVIRAVTRSRVSHTFLLVSDPFFQQLMVLEASGAGIRFVTLDVFQRSNKVVRLLTPPVPLDASVRRAADWLGERYAYEGLFGMLFVQIGRWFKRRWHNPLHSSHALFCSELNTLVVQAAGWPGAAALDPFSTNPEDLLECLTPTALPLPAPGWSLY